ncbi:MAG TPA: SH3 domain-containing protein [Candidatus Kryptonia bacterium]|nr:SH3 domain-containing protein [Candidatus Kryptonia bacterium]
MKAECPDAELLVAYVSGEGDNDAARAHIDAHVLDCDHCTQTIMVMHQRWRMAARVAVAVPAAVSAAVANPPVQPERDRHGLWAAVRERLNAFTRLPVLMPTAFAVGAVVMLLLQQIPWQPSGPLMRAVPFDQTLRVRAAAVRVFARPDTGTQVLAVLAPGTIVDVRDQNQEWYRIVLPDGREGWVEQAGLD